MKCGPLEVSTISNLGKTSACACEIHQLIEATVACLKRENEGRRKVEERTTTAI